MFSMGSAFLVQVCGVCVLLFRTTLCGMGRSSSKATSTDEAMRTWVKQKDMFPNASFFLKGFSCHTPCQDRFPDHTRHAANAADAAVGADAADAAAC